MVPHVQQAAHVTLSCAMSRSLRRQLSDPTSPLYRSLSQIPTGLRPIRTTSFSTDGEGSPESPAARPEPHKSLRNAASVPRRRSVGPGPGPAAVEPVCARLLVQTYGMIKLWLAGCNGTSQMGSAFWVLAVPQNWQHHSAGCPGFQGKTLAMRPFNASTSMLAHSMRKPSGVCLQAQPSMGYWAVQLGVIADMWRVVRGPESRAVRLALWIAVIDQAMASTAIVNYAPALIQQSSLSSSTSATLWTGAVTGSKVRVLRG